MSNDSSKRFWAISALGGAVAGAAVAHAYHKYRDAERRRQLEEQASGGRSPRKSLIFEDPNDSLNILFPHNHEEKMRRQIAARAAVEEDNFVPRNSVTVRVPATSANMGPGCT